MSSERPLKKIKKESFQSYEFVPATPRCISVIKSNVYDYTHSVVTISIRKIKIKSKKMHDVFQEKTFNDFIMGRTNSFNILQGDDDNPLCDALSCIVDDEAYDYDPEEETWASHVEDGVGSLVLFSE